MKHPRIIMAIVIFVLLLVAGAFYWWEWRPAKAREKCGNLALDISLTAAVVSPTPSVTYDSYNHVFKNCMDRKGVK